MTAPVYRPSIERAIQDIHGRLRNLEATPGAGDAIRFDVANVGGYLDISTNGPVDADGYGYQIVSRVNGDVLLGFPWDDTSESLGSLSGDVIVGVGYGGNRQIHFRCTNDANDGSYSEGVTIDDISLSLNASQPGGINSSGLLRDVATIASDTNAWAPVANVLAVRLKLGSKLRVFNSLNAAIFEVDEDGSLHGVTGKALVFDL